MVYLSLGIAALVVAVILDRIIAAKRYQNLSATLTLLADELMRVHDQAEAAAKDAHRVVCRLRPRNKRNIGSKCRSAARNVREFQRDRNGRIIPAS